MEKEMISTFFIIGQILTFISYLIFWISRFIKDKHKILLFDNVSRIVAILAFIFLGTYDGIKNTIYVILRNILGQFTNEKKKKYKLITLFVMLTILVLIYCFDFHGISTIFIALSGIFNLYGVIMCDEQGIRFFGMLGSFFYMGFMLFTGNIVGFICEIICFFVIFASYMKYRNKKDDLKSIE